MVDRPTAEQIVIRPATFADYKNIRDYDDFLGDRRLDIQRRELLVADCGHDRAVGFLKITPCNFLDRPLVNILCVVQRERRRGIGTRLLSAACDHYRGCQIYLTTEESNVIMRGLLDARGWETVGYIDGFNISGEREVIYRIGQWA